MQNVYDVTVIGAGPSGSYTALLLAKAGHRVMLLEQRNGAITPVCCTGVVGLPYLDLVKPDADVILAEAKSVTFFSPSGFRLHASSSIVQACVLDRPLLEYRMRGRAVKAGAVLREGFVACRITRSEDRINVSGRVNGAVEQFNCRALVLAAGVSPGLGRQVGIAAPRRFLVGAHTEVDMDGVLETEIYFMPDGVRGAFAWLVPVTGRRVRVGVLSMRCAAELCRSFLERPDIRKRLVGATGVISQRPVPVSPARRTYAAGALAVGDAAGQVKPTTGGGLYFGAIAAHHAVDAVNRCIRSGCLTSSSIGSYERAWKATLGGELRCGMLARGVYDRLTPAQVDRIIGHAERSGIADTLVHGSRFSFDYHSGALLFGLLKSLPGMVPLRNAFNRRAVQ